MSTKLKILRTYLNVLNFELSNKTLIIFIHCCILVVFQVLKIILFHFQINLDLYNITFSEL